MKPIFQQHPEWLDTDIIIQKHLQTHKSDIVYGGKSIRKQLGYRARSTYDYDIFSLDPKSDAYKLQREFNRLSHTEGYQVRPAIHKGTFKVFIRKGHKNLNILDFTKEPKNIKFIIIDGIKWRILKNELYGKERSLKDKSREFRRQKDLQDYKGIKEYLDSRDFIKHLF